MNRLFINNGAKWRLIRTIIQGIIGVLIANIDVIVGSVILSPSARAIVVALVMAVLSPIMAELGTYEMDKEELDRDYFEGGEADVSE